MSVTGTKGTALITGASAGIGVIYADRLSDVCLASSRRRIAMLTRVFLNMLASAVIGLAAFTHTARAETVCGPRDKIITTLGDEFQENRQSLGISGQSAVFELFVSIEGSWTLVATDTSGVSCLIAAGEAWQDAPLTVSGLNS